MRLYFPEQLLALALLLVAGLLLLASPQPLSADEAANDAAHVDSSDRQLDLATYCRYFSSSPYCASPHSGDDGAPLLFLVYFDPNAVSIPASEEPALRRALTAGKLEPSARIAITGHAADHDDPDRELDLSVRRAATVAQWLQERGIEQERISLSGAGASKPLLPVEQGEDQNLSRRAEILLDLY
ncbi:MAG TPA: OmpA family protein [Kiloniellales bacterium]|nr:OmpA family protein [Kiloniellales bacterium]